MSRPFYSDTSWVTKQSPTLEESASSLASSTPGKFAELVAQIHCDKCGKEWEEGDFPFCKGQQSDHIRSGRFSLDPFHGYVDPMLPGSEREVGIDLGGNTVEGIRLDSRDQRDRIMRENNLVSGGKVNRKKRSHFDEKLIDRIVNEAAEKVFRGR